MGVPYCLYCLYCLLRSYSDQKITLLDATLAVISKRLRVAVWAFDLMGVDVWREQE